MITLDQVEELGGYTVLYADPPWQYNDKGSNGAAEKHYSTMSIEEVCAMPVARLAAPTSALFLWAVGPMLPEAFMVMKAWGFTYKTVAFNWIKSKNAKDFFGLGRWTRQNAEYCLLGIRDRPERQSASVRQVLFGIEEMTLGAPLQRHSRKPDEARDRIVTLLGDVPRIELFARAKVEGWDAWGDEVQCDVDLGI